MDDINNELIDVLRVHGNGILGEPERLLAELERRLAGRSGPLRSHLVSLAAAAGTGIAGEMVACGRSAEERAVMVGRARQQLGVTDEMASWLVNTVTGAVAGRPSPPALAGRPPAPAAPVPAVALPARAAFAPPSPIGAPYVNQAGSANEPFSPSAPSSANRRGLITVGIVAAVLLCVIVGVLAFSGNDDGNESNPSATRDASDVSVDDTQSEDVEVTPAPTALATTAVPTAPPTTAVPTTPPTTVAPTTPPTTVAPTAPPTTAAPTPPTVSPQDTAFLAIQPGNCVERTGTGPGGPTGLQVIDCASPAAYGVMLAGGSQLETTTECPAEADVTLSFESSTSKFKFCIQRLAQGLTVEEFFTTTSSCTVGVGDYPAAGEVASSTCPGDGVTIHYVKHNRSEADYVAGLQAAGVPIERIGTWSSDETECGILYAASLPDSTILLFTFNTVPFAVRGVAPGGTTIQDLDSRTNFSYSTRGC